MSTSSAKRVGKERGPLLIHQPTKEDADKNHLVGLTGLHFFLASFVQLFYTHVQGPEMLPWYRSNESRFA